MNLLLEAEAEVQCITGDYEAKVPGLGARFRHEVEDACAAKELALIVAIKRLVVLGGFIDAHAALFDNPKMAVKWLREHGPQESLQQAVQGCGVHAHGAAKHGDAMVQRRRETQRIGKVEIERDDRPAILAAADRHLLVGGGTKLLLRYGADIVPGGGEHFLASLPEVLIKLELHAAASSATDT